MLFINLGPTTFASARSIDPLSSFLMFMEPIEKIIIEMTNLYGARRYKNKWKPVDVTTMRAYYGVLLLAGVYRSKGEDITELWDDYHGRPIFRAAMSLQKFQVINQCIRFDDKELRILTQERDKLQPIRNVFNKWNQRVRALYVPGKCVTVDEQLLPFRGRCPFKQYIPSKPAKYGIKIWVVCDSKTFYAYNLEPYVGRDRNNAANINTGEMIVLRLTEGLNGRNVTCDNYFTSHSLATELKKRQMTIVGTIRKNRNELPPILVDMKRKPAEYSEFVFDHKLRATMVSYVPKKYKFVTLLSTYHTENRIDEADKKKPEIIKFYNSTKGAVDTLDEMVGTYRCKRKVWRWPLAFFENMLDISAVNAMVIFLENNPHWPHANKKERRRLFLVELGNALVAPYIATRKRMPRSNRAQDIVLDMKGLPREHSPASSSNASSRATTPTLPSRSTTPSSSRASTPGVSSGSSIFNWLSTLKHAVQTKKRARCFKCPNVPTASSYTIRCDKCERGVCPEHRFTICSSCCGQQ